MNWLKNNWPWAALNLAALVALGNLLAQALWLSGPHPDYNAWLAASGKWAIRFLLFSLLMTPLNAVLGWRSALKLRRPAGLWGFAFVVLHTAFNIAGTTENWLQYPIPDYLAGLGVVALSILAAMAATSFQWAMKRLGRWWKRLHRLVYVAGLIALTHAWLEAPSKRVAAYNVLVGPEVILYAVLWLALLTARLPAVRGALRRLVAHR